MNRRQFIRTGAAAAGGAAIAGGLVSDWYGLDGPRPIDPKTDGDRIVPTFCELCFWKCGVLAHVKDGRVTKITGNPDHPLSRGRLCPRGTGGTGLLYDPDRLKTAARPRPEARRAGLRGGVAGRRPSTRSPRRMLQIKTSIRPRSDRPLLPRLRRLAGSSTCCTAYGSPNVAAPSYAQCRGPREVGFQLTFGAGVGSPEPIDMEHSRVHHPHRLAPRREHAQHAGPGLRHAPSATARELIVVDPRFSTAAGKARYWLPIKPGTDIALLLAWMHVIDRRGALRPRLRRASTPSASTELRAHVADKTPEWAYPQTTIRPEAIRETARFIAGARPAVARPSGAARHLVRRRHAALPRDRDPQRAPRVVGTRGRLSSSRRRWSSRSIPYHPVRGRRRSARPTAQDGGATRSPTTTLASGPLRRDACPASADLRRQGLDRLRHEPAARRCPQPENDDAGASRSSTSWRRSTSCRRRSPAGPTSSCPRRPTSSAATRSHAPPYKEPFLAMRQQVVPPMYDSKPGWWIARELAHRLGLGGVLPLEGQRWSTRRHRLQGGRLRLRGAAAKGVVRGDAGARVPIEEGVEPAFDPHREDRALLEAARRARLRSDPGLHAARGAAAGALPALFGRAPVHTFGRTTNNRFLSEVCSRERGLAQRHGGARHRARARREA